MFLRSILPFVQAPHDEYKRNMAFCRVDFNFIFQVEETIASKMDVFSLSIFHEIGWIEPFERNGVFFLAKISWLSTDNLGYQLTADLWGVTSTILVLSRDVIIKNRKRRRGAKWHTALKDARR